MYYFTERNNSMKQIIACLICLSLCMGLGMIPAFADEGYHQQGEFWMLDAPKTDEIISASAGYEDTTWTVPYLNEKPVIDGIIGEEEYREFKNFNDYLTLMAPISGTTEEEFDTFRMNAEFFSGDSGFVTIHWGWDGEYLYMAFTVQNLNGFYCNPQSSLYLFTQNCLQIGIGDEFVSGNQYTELGFGVNSESGDLITHTWLGSYQTDKETDYAGHYNEDTGIVTYELRIDLEKTVGVHYDEGVSVAAGDVFKLAWLLSVNGQGNRPDDKGNATSGEEWQIGFCHGIGGPYSYKESAYFAAITLGAPGEDPDETVAESETVTETEDATETEAETPVESLPVESTPTESETVADTDAETKPAETEAETPAETEPADDAGCASIIPVGTGLSALIACGALIVFRKKDPTFHTTKGRKP